MLLHSFRTSTGTDFSSLSLPCQQRVDAAAVALIQQRSHKRGSGGEDKDTAVSGPILRLKAHTAAAGVSDSGINAQNA